MLCVPPVCVEAWWARPVCAASSWGPPGPKWSAPTLPLPQVTTHKPHCVPIRQILQILYFSFYFPPSLSVRYASAGRQYSPARDCGGARTGHTRANLTVRAGEASASRHTGVVPVQPSSLQLIKSRQHSYVSRMDRVPTPILPTGFSGYPPMPPSSVHTNPVALEFAPPPPRNSAQSLWQGKALYGARGPRVLISGLNCNLHRDFRFVAAFPCPITPENVHRPACLPRPAAVCWAIGPLDRPTGCVSHQTSRPTGRPSDSLPAPLPASRLVLPPSGICSPAARPFLK